MNLRDALKDGLRDLINRLSWERLPLVQLNQIAKT
jgi:hypothetical protein